jgi:hypothetical protein
MIIAAMIAFQLVACGLILLLVRYELRRYDRIMAAAVAEAKADLRARAERDRIADAERAARWESDVRVLTPPDRMETFPPPIEVVEMRSQDELAGKPMPPPVEVIPPGRVKDVELHDHEVSNGYPRDAGEPHKSDMSSSPPDERLQTGAPE